MSVHVIDEARRCLNCKNPGCMKGCPIHTPVPEMIRCILEEEDGLTKAGRLVLENNPLAFVCALVCGQEARCEEHCIWNDRGNPIQISNIEEYIADTILDKYQFQQRPSNGKMAAVIGSGPAVITIAILLAQWGYEVTIFESRDKIGGVLRYGIPDFRLPKTVLDRYEKKLVKLGIQIRPNTTIGGGALTLEDLFRDGYCSVYTGAGVWWPKTLGIRGESLGNVHYGIDYLANPDVFALGERVAIIGAGNAAVDVARTALRHGAREVTLYELKPAAAATETEQCYARMDGARFEFGKKIVEITREGPVFHNVRYDNAGQVLEESEACEQIPADSTIIAISQTPISRITPAMEGVFASGDSVQTHRTIVEAVEHSKRVAVAMDEFMRGK